MKYYTVQFAQAYGTGSYGDCGYSEGQTTSGTCAATATPNSSTGLADTGIAIVGIVTLACLLVFVALTVRLWRSKSVPAVEESIEDDGISVDHDLKNPRGGI